MPAVVLALCAAVSWGTGDFLAGITSRRLGVMSVLAFSQLIGFLGVAVWVAASGDSWPGWENVLPALGGGIAGSVGLGCLYRGMTVGAIGIVAPISATAPAVPLLVDLVRGVAPTALQWLGIVLASAGVVIVSRSPRTVGRRRVAAGTGLALLSALGFGLFYVGLGAASDASVPWAVASARAASAALAVTAGLVVGARLLPPSRFLPAVAAVGVFDTGANVLVGLATSTGLTGIVAVLSSLYPLVTIALARAVLREPITRLQRGGIVAALAGAALIAAG